MLLAEKYPGTDSLREIEPTAGAGLTDWKRVAESLGYHSLSATMESLSPDNLPVGVNSHREIDNKLKLLDLPGQSCVYASLGEFLTDYDKFLSMIPDGDYYFVSIKPGVHLAHGMTAQEVIDFVYDYVAKNPDADMNQEIYLSHNGEPVMSGHVIINKGNGTFNSIVSEFTIGNFNAFHRGFHSPEIALHRSDYRFEWGFRGELHSFNGDWRDEKTYMCNGGIELTRTEMAEIIYDAVTRIPHDGEYYLPGYYEVLLEKTSQNQTRPVFIEAVVGALA